MKQLIKFFDKYIISKQQAKDKAEKSLIWITLQVAFYLSIFFVLFQYIFFYTVNERVILIVFLSTYILFISIFSIRYSKKKTIEIELSEEENKKYKLTKIIFGALPFVLFFISFVISLIRGDFY